MEVKVALIMTFGLSTVFVLVSIIFPPVFPHILSMWLRSEGPFRLLKWLLLSMVLLHSFLLHVFPPLKILLVFLDTVRCKQSAFLAMTF